MATVDVLGLLVDAVGVRELKKKATVSVMHRTIGLMN
jgi:hypothetical protein